MKKMLMALTAAIYGFAAAQEFRIDVGSSKGVSLSPGVPGEGITVQQAAWQIEKRDSRLIFTGKAETMWRKHSFSFIPRQSGTVDVSFMGQPKKKPFIAYRNISVKGSNFNNSDFKLIKDNSPVGWYKLGSPGFQNNTIFCRHDDRFFKPLVCKEGIPVTLTFQVKIE